MVDNNNRKGVPLDQAKRQRAREIGGEAMTEVGKQRQKEHTAKDGLIKTFESRADVLGKTPYEYLKDMREGKAVNMSLPQEYIAYLDKKAPVPIAQSVQATTAPNQSVAQNVPAPPTSESSDMSFMNMLTDKGQGRSGPTTASPGDSVAMSPELAALVGSSDFADLNKQSTYTPPKGPLEAPAPIPVQTNVQTKELNLVNSLWSDSENLLKFEQLVSILLEMGYDGAMITRYQGEIDTYGIEYLNELLKRMTWRMLFHKNRQKLNQKENIIRESLLLYERLLIPMKDIICSKEDGGSDETREDNDS